MLAMDRSAPLLCLLLLASACAGGSTARGGEGGSAGEGPPRIECGSDGDCPLEAGLCIAFDRAGGRDGPGPTRRQCVATCESQEDCGAGFRCSDRYEAFRQEEEDGASFGMALSQGVCAPIPRGASSGNVRLVPASCRHSAQRGLGLQPRTRSAK